MIWVWAIVVGIVFGVAGVYIGAVRGKEMITKAGRPQDTSTVVAMAVLMGLAGFMTGLTITFALILTLTTPITSLL